MKRKRFWSAIALTVVGTAVAALLFGPMRGAPSDSIETRYAEGDLSGTLAAIDSAPEKGGGVRDRLHAHFLAANCYRQLGLHRQFQQELERMRALEGSADVVNLAMAMFKIQHGELTDSPAALVEVLKSAGASDADARSVAVQGAFAAGKLDEAQQLLDQWRIAHAAGAHAAPAQLEYLTAVAFNQSGATDQAEARWISIIEQHPRHELSWLALSELYSRPPNVRFLQSERVLERLADRFSHNPDVHLRLARMRRRLGKAEQSKPALVAARSEAELLEKANIEFDLGSYQQSVATLKELGLATATDFRRLTDAAFELSLRGQGEAGGELTQRVSWGATALALSGDHTAAQAVFDDAVERTARLRRLQDLSNLQATEPRRESVAEEMNALVSLSNTSVFTAPPERFDSAEGSAANLRGLELYQLHCANCHGQSGRGDGRAACNLFPAPRNFRDEPTRLISSDNQVASPEDLARTIRRGEPGTSMPAFEALSGAEVNSLVEVLRHFTTEGLKDVYARELAAGNLEPSPNREREWLAARSEPGSPLAIPELRSTPALVARGGELFGTVGCANCHALGDQPAPAQTRLFDSLGRPIVAPRLDVDPFHGGDQPSEIYKRIALGIPGTPHPALASSNVEDAESLVAYIGSIRKKRPAALSNNQRASAVLGSNARPVTEHPSAGGR